MEILKNFVANRDLVFRLSINDFKNRFAGSYLGIVWAFIQPVISVLIYWFVFEVGFKSAPIKDFPFVLWLIAGIVPWFFFSEALMSATNGLLEYSYLVKKVVFNINIIPVIKIVSAMFVHFFFVGFTMILFIGYKVPMSIHWFQIIYYSICTICLVSAISYITASLIVFMRDIGQIINIMLQIGMWLTPIMWSYDIMPDLYRNIIKLNPMYYIVEGYRDSLINQIWFWERPYQTMNFWLIVGSLMMIGIYTFKKLKPHFADVL